MAPHIVFLNYQAAGHVNPTLGLVVELRKRGCFVTYFVAEDVKDVVEGAGATWRPWRRPGSEETGVASKLDAEGMARLKLPAMAFLSYPGMGVSAADDKMSEATWVVGPQKELLAKYGYDILSKGRPGDWYSQDGNLEPLYHGPKFGYQSETLCDVPFTCVGALSVASGKRVANASVKDDLKDKWAEVLGKLDAEKAAGKKVVYVSMGTVGSRTDMWNRKFGVKGMANGLADATGKEAIQHCFRCCLQALGRLTDSVVVAMALGPHADALEGLPPVPPNFVVAPAMPQLEVLERTDAFVTHGGANSVHEGLDAGVPLIVVPLFGDQPLNGDRVASLVAGVCFRDPLKALTPEALEAAVTRALAPGGKLAEGARKLKMQLTESGGASTAAETILAVVARHA